MLTLTKRLIYNKNKLSVTFNFGGDKLINVNSNIEKIRLSKGITRKFVAEKCNKTQQWYWKVEKGLIIPDANNLQLIAKALQVDVKIFFEEKLNDTLNKESA